MEINIQFLYFTIRYLKLHVHAAIQKLNKIIVAIMTYIFLEQKTLIYNMNIHRQNNFQIKN